MILVGCRGDCALRIIADKNHFTNYTGEPTNTPELVKESWHLYDCVTLNSAIFVLPTMQ